MLRFYFVVNLIKKNKINIKKRLMKNKVFMLVFVIVIILLISIIY